MKPDIVKEASTTLNIYKNEQSIIAKPFIKWAGGKGQLIEEISKRLPIGLGFSINKYAEPFVGGGAVLFYLLSNYNFKEVYISDINLDLINTYKIIRDNPYELISLLKTLKEQYTNTNSQKNFYYDVRNKYNTLKINNDLNTNIEKAGLFIFLNKTCFNGLYRVNRKGKFNVPRGSYKNPAICDEDNLINVSILLKNVIIEWKDYKASKGFIDENTLVYFDPPYRPLNQTSNFNTYTQDGFSDKDQIELANFVQEISKKDAKIILSNSDPKNISNNDNFFDDLYSDFKITRISATRMINSKGSARGKINELLITNF